MSERGMRALFVSGAQTLAMSLLCQKAETIARANEKNPSFPGKLQQSVESLEYPSF